MGEYTKRKLKIAGGLVGFALCLALIVVGQRQVGWASLGLMMLGLAGMLALLYLYNRGVEKPKQSGLYTQNLQHGEKDA